MPILYSAVGFNKQITNSYASCDGNFKEIAETLIIKVSNNNSKMTYSHGNYLLHYILENKSFYLCVTDKTCQRSRAFLFLNEIKRKHCEGVNEFTRVLVCEMHKYNEDYNTITIRKGDLDELNTIGVDTSEGILGEQILYVKNENILEYTTTRSINTTPKRVIITLSDCNSKKIIILIVISLFIMCIIKCPYPMTLVFIIIVLFMINYFSNVDYS